MKYVKLFHIDEFKPEVQEHIRTYTMVYGYGDSYVWFPMWSNDDIEKECAGAGEIVAITDNVLFAAMRAIRNELAFQLCKMTDYIMIEV